jgi:hypothetical protein
MKAPTIAPTTDAAKAERFIACLPLTSHGSTGAQRSRYLGPLSGPRIRRVCHTLKPSRYKAADRDGNPAGAETIGLLGRLQVRSKKLARIGKEVDRLDEDEGAALEPEQPVEYKRDDLAEDIEY